MKLKIKFNNSLTRTIVYTIGHIAIATICNMFITGAQAELAMTDAIVEPLLNSVWYYVLDVLCVKYFNNKNWIWTEDNL